MQPLGKLLVRALNLVEQCVNHDAKGAGELGGIEMPNEGVLEWSGHFAGQKVDAAAVDGRKAVADLELANGVSQLSQQQEREIVAAFGVVNPFFDRGGDHRDDVVEGLAVRSHQEIGEAGLAELLLGGVFGLGNPVGEDGEEIAGAQQDFLLFVLDVR